MPLCSRFKALATPCAAPSEYRGPWQSGTRTPVSQSASASACIQVNWLSTVTIFLADMSTSPPESLLVQLLARYWFLHCCANWSSLRESLHLNLKDLSL